VEMPLIKTIGRLFKGEESEQPNLVKVKPIYRTEPTSLDIKANKKADNVSGKNESLLNELKKCRASIARREGIKPYMVFADWELNAIIDAKPINERELSWIEGFDEEKAFKYGKEMSRIFRYL